ncbi:hypothetical protein KUTeg_015769 [Tegillarca granosa]|uniref:Solute carrier family 46 member 3 n=1 Tax=Tegillarca granosa TaxID=220873 RepID=A0ABQ9ENB5_TEGGR|nr:hypothetical protein KUTeg_015769 [Tegillarca granosa]
MEIETEVSQKKLSMRKYLIGPIIFINIYAFFLPSIILPQYGFQAFQKRIFPNHTFASGEQTLCNTNTSTEQFHNQQTVTTETATWNLYNSLASCLPAVITNFIFGSYSDQYGRKLFLALSTSGSFLKIGLCCVGAYLGWGIYYFILFYAFDGITGMWICFITISYSYVADITRKGKSRTFAIVLVELCVGLAAVSASITSGYFVRNFGFVLPLATCAGLLLIQMILLVCFLPETVQKRKNKKQISITEQAKRVFRFYLKDNPASGGYRWKFIVCILIFILVSHSVLGRGVETLYQLNTPFCWSSVFIGWYTTITTVVQNVVGMAIAKILQNYLSELSIAIIAMLSFTSGFLLEGFASNDIELFLGKQV